MVIQGPLCIIPNHDDHGIMEIIYGFILFMEVQDDGRLVPKLTIFNKSCFWNFSGRSIYFENSYLLQFRSKNYKAYRFGIPKESSKIICGPCWLKSPESYLIWSKTESCPEIRQIGDVLTKRPYLTHLKSKLDNSTWVRKPTQRSTNPCTPCCPDHLGRYPKIEDKQRHENSFLFVLGLLYFS